MLQSQGRIEEAVQQYQQAIEWEPDLVRPRYNLGCILASQGKFAEAIEQYQDALRLEPYASEVRNNLGIALASSGNLDEAIAQFHKAIELRPDFAEAHVNLGHGLATQGNFVEAIEHYKKPCGSTQRTPATTTIWRLPWPIAGIWRRPPNSFGEAARLDPNLPDVHGALAKVLEKQGNQDEAERDIIEKQLHTEPVSKQGPRTTVVPIPARSAADENTVLRIGEHRQFESLARSSRTKRKVSVGCHIAVAHLLVTVLRHQQVKGVWLGAAGRKWSADSLRLEF